MNRKIVGVALAVLLAALGTLGVLRYVATAEARALEGVRTVDVLVVREPVERGLPAEGLRTAVERTRVPASVRPADAVTDLGDLEGKVALVDLVPGEQLVAARFGSFETLAEQTGVDVPDGLHLVSVKLPAERAVAGSLRAGQKVAVTSSFDPFEATDGSNQKSPNSSHIILHKVLVTSVVPTTGTGSPAGDDTQTQEPATPPSQEYFVTLAVDAPSVERVVFTAEHGFLWLSVEPDDAPEDGTSIQTRGTIYGEQP